MGNAAILTNVCLLPLYPGVVAYLLGLTSRGAAELPDDPSGALPGDRTVAGATGAAPLPGRRRAALLGLCVLAGVLALMAGLALILTLLRVSLAGLLPVLLPVVYLSVIALGALLVAGRNPLERLQTPGGRLPRRPYRAAFAYGLLLGPMTLPCTGPIVLSAFVLGLGSTGFLLEGLAYFAAFGLGFGWPLVLLPVLTTETSRRFGAWFGRHHLLLTHLSGWLLVSIGLFGLLYEVLPNVL